MDGGLSISGWRGARTKPLSFAQRRRPFARGRDDSLTRIAPMLLWLDTRFIVDFPQLQP